MGCGDEGGGDVSRQAASDRERLTRAREQAGPATELLEQTGAAPLPGCRVAQSEVAGEEVPVSGEPEERTRPHRRRHGIPLANRRGEEPPALRGGEGGTGPYCNQGDPAAR